MGEDFPLRPPTAWHVARARGVGGTRHRLTVLGHRLVGPDGQPARDDAQVSSTAIRRGLNEGRLGDADAMLGRDHEMRGAVVHGDRRGRTLGFPTANVAIPDEMLMPADGIYAGWLQRSPTAPTALPAAIYVGKRPTFYDDRAMTLLEVHVLDFDGDLYDEAWRSASAIGSDRMPVSSPSERPGGAARPRLRRGEARSLLLGGADRGAEPPRPVGEVADRRGNKHGGRAVPCPEGRWGDVTDLVEPIEEPVHDEPLAESGFDAPPLRHTVTLGDGRGRCHGCRRGRPARGRARVLGRGVPVRAVAVPAGAHGLPRGSRSTPLGTAPPKGSRCPGRA